MTENQIFADKHINEIKIIINKSAFDSMSSCKELKKLDQKNIDELIKSLTFSEN